MWRIAKIIKNNPNTSFAVHIQNESEFVGLVKTLEQVGCTIQFNPCEISDLRGWMEELAKEYDYDICFRINENKEVAANPSIEHWRVYCGNIIEKRGHELKVHNRDYTAYGAEVEAEKILEQLAEDGDFIRKLHGFIADNITKEQMINWLMGRDDDMNENNLNIEDVENENVEEEEEVDREDEEDEDDEEMLEPEEKYEPPVTVNYMLDLCQRLANAGYGDMVFKCNDGTLHEDEIGCNYIARELTFRGFLFNDSIVQNMAQFVQSVKDAEEKFYRSMDKK